MQRNKWSLKNIAHFKKHTLFKMLILYCTFTFVIIYSVTAIQMHYSRQKLREKIYDSHINGLKAMQIYSDINIVEKINNILLSLQVDTNGHVSIRDFVSAQLPVNEKDIYNTYTELLQVILENPVIHSIDLYNKYGNLCVSSDSGVTYYNGKSPFYDYFYDARAPMWTDTDDGFISVINTFPLYASAEEKYAGSIIRLNKTTVNMLLNQQQAGGGGIEFFICDKEFHVLAGTGAENFDLQMDAEKLRSGESAEMTIDGANSQVFSVGSAYGDWNYVYTISERLYQKEINELNRVSFWNVLAMTVLSFCGLSLISQWLYRPIRDMLNSLKKHFKSEQNDSDIAFISEEIHHLIQQVDDVNAIVEQNKPLLIGHLIMETVYGNIETKELKARLEAVDIDFAAGKIIPVIVNINEQVLKPMDAKQQSYLLVQASEILAAGVSERYPCIATKISYDNVVGFVLCDAEDVLESLRIAADNLRRFGLEEINLIAGEPEENAEALGRQCRKILALTKYSFVYGYANILEAKTLEAREQNMGRTAEEMMPFLESLLAKENLAGAESFVENLYQECKRNCYSCDCIQQYFFEILRLMARFTKMHGSVPKMTEQELGDMHAIYEHICQTFESLEGNIQSDSHEEIFVQQVKEYITANARNDISQGSVARQFNVSTAHLSRVFKKVTGMKFSDFVTETKLSEAARMLREHPEMTVARVAECFGYYNMNYFNTLFKKRFLMTPSQYRKA